jgi:hypothetical protein
MFCSGLYILIKLIKDIVKFRDLNDRENRVAVKDPLEIIKEMSC